MRIATQLGAVGVLLCLTLWPAGAGAESNMDRIREKAEEFMVAFHRADFRHRAEGDEAAYDRVYKDFGYLFSPTKIADIRDVREDRSDVGEQRALDLLAAFIEEQIAGARTAPMVDELENLMLEEEEEIPGKGKGPFPEIRTVALFDPDRRARKFGHVIVTDKYTIYNVYRNQILVSLIDAAKGLGFTDYPAMRAAHQGIDYGTLKAVCEELLQETAGAYEQGLDTYSEKVLGISRDKMRRYDLEFLTLSSEMDEAIGNADRKKLWRTMEKALRLPTGDDILDTEWKSEKKRSPFDDVYPIDLLKDIEVAGRPRGATANVASWLSALGRSQRLLNLQTPQFEFRRLQEGAYDHAAGYLFEGLLAERGFTTSVLGLNETQAAELAASRRFADLVSLRIDAANFLFGFVIYEDFRLAQSRYNENMENYLKTPFLKVDSELYLEDFTFEAAERLAGRLLAAQLADLLVNRFGQAWWSSAEAGDFLKSMWADGTRLSLEQLGNTYGFTIFDSSKLVAAAGGPAME